MLELSGADFVLLIEPGEDRAPSTSPPAPASTARRRPTPSPARASCSARSASAASPPSSPSSRRAASSAPSARPRRCYEPLVLDRQPIGVFAVAYRSGRRRVGERTASLLSMLAAEAALAIDREDLIARLDFMARRDELTGLVNRRVLRETLDAELSAAGRVRAAPLALAILDLDSFKQVNDRLGHQAGDRLLKTAAAAWVAELRSGGTIGRYGGDEFVAILPGVDGGSRGGRRRAAARRRPRRGDLLGRGRGLGRRGERGAADRRRRRPPLRGQGERPRPHRDGAAARSLAPGSPRPRPSRRPRSPPAGAPSPSAPRPACRFHRPP